MCRWFVMLWQAIERLFGWEDEVVEEVVIDTPVYICTKVL